MSGYRVSENAVAQLRKMAQNIVNSAGNIQQAAEKVGSVFEENQSGLGPHSQAIAGILEELQSSNRSVVRDATKLGMKFLAAALIRENILNRNRYGEQGDGSADGSSGGSSSGGNSSGRGAPKKMTAEECQQIADACAQDYNQRMKPCEKCAQRGLTGIKQTKNGGISFADSPYVYTFNGQKCVTRIVMTGRSRTADYKEALKKMGMDSTPPHYIWHHVDDFDAATGECSIELVDERTHVQVKHGGACSQYDAVHGPTYNPPKRKVSL